MDVANMKWSNIDLANGLLDFRVRKTGKRAVIALHDDFVEWLANQSRRTRIWSSVQSGPRTQWSGTPTILLIASAHLSLSSPGCSPSLNSAATVPTIFSRAASTAETG